MRIAVSLSNYFKKNLVHIFYLSLLFLLTLFFLRDWLVPYNFTWGEDISSYLPRAEILKKAIFEYNDFIPLWSPYTMGGTPFFAKPDTVTIGHPLYLFILILPTALAIKLNFILNVFLAGVFMYILMIYLKLEPKFAFFSAIVFMFNGFVSKIFGWGWQTTLNAYTLLPLIFLFVIKASKEKNWALNSIIAGILLAIQFYGGPDMKVFLFTLIAIGTYLFVSILNVNFLTRGIKSLLIIFLMGIICFGLVAIKFLPEKEYIDLSSRAKISFEMASSRSVPFSTMFSRLIEPFNNFKPFRSGTGDHIGLIAFFVVIFAFAFNLKNRFILFSLILIIFSILFANGGFFFRFLWENIPPFGSFRYPDRALVLFVFASSILIGFGASSLSNYLEKNFKIKKNLLNLILFLIAILIIIDLLIFGYTTTPWGKSWNIKTAIENQDILKYMSEDKSLFRMHNYETKGIDWGTELFNVPYGLKSIYGYEGAWLVEYMNVYLGLPYANNDFAKFWGILNVKYVTSQTPLNITGFKFLKKFPECIVCYPNIDAIQKSWGPYLYENEKFLPHQYIINASILILGKKDSALQAMYSLLLDPNFDPKNVVIILGDRTSASEYTLEELKRYTAILLTSQEAIGGNSNYILQNYMKEGGMVLPNVIEGKTNVEKEDIDNMWKKANGTMKIVPDENVLIHNFENQEIKIEGSQNGFLIMSELFSLYPGWNAKVEEKPRKILRANGVVSAIFIDADTKLIKFNYKPTSFFVGELITGITILILMTYFIFVHIIKSKNKK